MRKGVSSSRTMGISTRSWATSRASSSPSVATAMTCASRAFASWRLLSVRSYQLSFGASTSTGTLLSMSAIGPCFISPAA